jgi:hypothetical protein
VEDVISEWHAAVNDGDLARAAHVVSDPILVLGPKGAGPITPAQFAEWVVRSGIKLVPTRWHPISDRLMVVEEDATWPGNVEPATVATVFRLTDGKVSAALRKPDLASALELAAAMAE